MNEIFRLLEEIVNLAERQEEFYEVETMVCIRRRCGAESDFIRMELDITDGGRSRVTTKRSQSAACVNMPGLVPVTDWF